MAASISPAPVRPPLLPAWVWWPVAVVAALGCGFLTLRSVQLTAACVLVIAVVGLYLRSRRAGLAAVWVVWLLVPLVRRVFALSEGYGDADPLALAPFAATGVVAAVELGRARLSRRARLVLCLGLGGLLFGLPAGLFGGVQSATFAAGAYGSAVLFFVAGYREPQDGELSLGTVFAIAAAPIALYAVLQSILPLPAWDAAWLQSVDFVSAGNQEEGTLRSFATLNSPGTLAGVLGLAAIFLLARRRFTPVEVASLLVLLAGIAVTLVRGAWVATALALVLLVVLAPARLGRRVGLVALLAVFALPFATGSTPAGEDIEQRATTFTSLSTDRSAQARIATPSVLAPIAVREPLGLGLGSAGEASRLAQAAVLRAPDNALLSLMIQLGPVGLALVLAGVGLGAASALRAVRRRGSTRDLAVLGGVAMLCVLMLFGDVFYGVTGVILWYLLGAAVRADDSTTPRTAT